MIENALASSLCGAVLQADVALFASFMFQSQAPRDLLSFVEDTINTPPKVCCTSKVWLIIPPPAPRVKRARNGLETLLRFSCRLFV